MSIVTSSQDISTRKADMLVVILHSLTIEESALDAGKMCKDVGLGPVTLRIAASGGAHYGDCPPYEAHQLGGVNCVRGWAEGGMGTGRNWLQSTAEVEWQALDNVHGNEFTPIYKVLCGH